MQMRRTSLSSEFTHSFALTGILYGFQQQALLDGPSRWPFAIVFLADLPVSLVAFGAMFNGWPDALYFLAAWRERTRWIATEQETIVCEFTELFTRIRAPMFN